EPAGDEKVLQIARRPIAVVPRVALAVTLTHFGIFARNVEGFRELAGGQHVQRLLRECVLTFELAAGIEIAPNAIYVGEKLPTIVKPIGADSGQPQIALPLAIGSKRGMRGPK